jgi:hypothetical protein
MICSSDDFLQVHGVDPTAWAKRWELEPFKTECGDCGAEKHTTIPFAAASGIRGLIAPPCPCGSASRTYCMVRDPKVGDLLDPKFAPSRRKGDRHV